MSILSKKSHEIDQKSINSRAVSLRIREDFSKALM